jgi:hypothetical protein
MVANAHGAEHDQLDAKNGLEVTASKSSSDGNTPVALEGQTEHLPTFEHEKRLALKFDIRILPMLAVMYLFNALDKGNLGNAKTDHMDVDLHFKKGQYNTMLSIFFVPYVLFAPPIAMLGKRIGPYRMLPILMACFGSMTLLSATTKNWSGMMALRWFLGKSGSDLFHAATNIMCGIKTTETDL